MANRVLVVDDDAALRAALARALALEGYDVDVAEDGARAVACFEDGDAPDVVVLDVLMPNLDGLGACRRIRARSDVPILMLTARDEIGDRIAGLDAGADDYLGKPFAVAELLARLRALLRRSTSDGVLRYADLELNLDERRGRRGACEFELTRIEFALLELLLQNPRKVLDRATVFQQVWGYDIELSSNSLEVFIGALRRKTESGGAPRLIHTIRGVGYVLREQE
ncbi:MAG: response regulator transcription factor [Polyangia bacterium]